MTRTTPDCPAAVHDSQLNTSGGGRVQDARTGAPLPASAPPASAPPRRAAGPSTPAHSSQEAPRAGVDPDSAAADLALSSAAADQYPRPGRSQRGAGTGLSSPQQALTGAAGGNARPGRGVDGTARPGQDAIAAAMSEDDLLSNVTSGTRKRPGLCKLYGLRWYHTHNSRRSPSGFPDLVIVGQWTIYRELKRQKENPTRAQREWIADLEAAGDDVDVWRPSDWLSGRIQRELAGLAGIRGAR